MVLVRKIMDPHILENSETLSAYQVALCSIVSDQAEMILSKKELKITSRTNETDVINLMEICVC
jgi:hypothetical protein